MNASVIYGCFNCFSVQNTITFYIYMICCGVRGIKIGLHVYNVMFVKFCFIYCYFTQFLNAIIIKSDSDVTYLFLDNAFLFSASTCFLEKWGNVMAYFKSRTPRGSIESH